MGYKTKSQMIQEAEMNLKEIEHIIAIGGYKDTETEQDMLDLAQKDLAYTKGRIGFKEYRKAYNKVYSKGRGVN